MRLLALALLCALFVACGSEAAGEKVLRFTAIPDDNTTLLKQRFDPVAAYLSEQLGVKVEYVPSKDYSASVEMFRNGDVQLAWFGGLTGVQARHAVKGAHAIVQGESDPNFHTYFVAHKDTGLARSEEFPTAIGKLKFAFGSNSSTSGRLMPEFFIRQNTGKGPDDFFEQPYTFSGSHDKTAKLVESGQVQAGALNYKTYDRMVAEGKLDADMCRVIWKTPPYADYNITVHPDVEEMFHEGFAKKLQAAMVGMSDPALLAAFDRKKLIPAKDEEFAGIVEVARNLGMLE